MDGERVIASSVQKAWHIWIANEIWWQFSPWHDEGDCSMMHSFILLVPPRDLCDYSRFSSRWRCTWWWSGGNLIRVAKSSHPSSEAGRRGVLLAPTNWLIGFLIYSPPSPVPLHDLLLMCALRVEGVSGTWVLKGKEKKHWELYGFFRWGCEFITTRIEEWHFLEEKKMRTLYGKQKITSGDDVWVFSWFFFFFTFT